MYITVRKLISKVSALDDLPAVMTKSHPQVTWKFNLSHDKMIVEK